MRTSTLLTQRLMTMTYKEFYIWLEGYLTDKLESSIVELSPIIKKMSEVNENSILDGLQKRKNEFHRTILPTIKIEPHPKVPKIICQDDKENSSF